MHDETRARLQVLGAAVLFSTGGAVVKLTELDGWQIAGLRSALATLTLFLVLPGARRRWTGDALAVGVAYAGALIGFTLATKWTTAANAVFLAATAPLYVALLSPWLLKERLRRSDLGFMVVMAGGLALCLTDSEARFATAPQPALGNAVAILTGVLWALTVLGLRLLGKAGDPSDRQGVAVVSGNLMALVICLPRVVPVPSLELSDVLVLAYLGTIQIGLAYVFLNAGLRRVPALEASLLMLSEPVLNSLLTWLVHGEVQGRWAMLGAGLILIATVLKAVLTRGGPPP